MNIEIRPATPQERLYTYPQSNEISVQTGYIGGMEVKLDVGDSNIFVNWDEFSSEPKTDTFNAGFNTEARAMRFHEQYGDLLKNLRAVNTFCQTHPESRFNEGRCTMYAFRMDIEQYTYMLRVNPSLKDTTLYAYCYERMWFSRHLEHAKHGISFITPDYKEKFRIADGDMIRIVTKGGEYRDHTARFIDECHLELNHADGSGIYHICEFAELFVRNDCQDLIPLRASLPEYCYNVLSRTTEVIIHNRGETDYYRTGFSAASKEEAKRIANEHNAKLGITKAQAAAMAAGAMFGFHVSAADPANYDKDGQPIKPKHRDREDAR